MLATESFFKGGRSPPKKFNRKERKDRKEIEGGNGNPVKISRKVREVRKEMEGGNGASAASGITQFAEGEPKLWN